MHEETVPELGGGTFLVPRERSAILAVAQLRGEPDPRSLRNGQRLHFDARGDLLAIDSAPSRVVYRRDESGRLSHLELARRGTARGHHPRL